MMKIVTHLLVALLSAGLVMYYLNAKLANVSKNHAIMELNTVKAIVEKNVDFIQKNILKKLRVFCGVVSENQEFIMKLAVEKDVSAPEIVDIAGNYIKVMGLSFLEIVTDSGIIISSGHFPASAGSKSLKQLLGEDAILCITDDIKGKKVLSLQGRIRFVCSGVPLYCIGGISVDEDFINEVKPLRNTDVFLKQGNEILGIDTLRTISDIRENSIMINDKTRLAASISLPWAGQGEQPSLIILQHEPYKFNRFTIF
jgi:hypothetical protein